jgi:excisionase family DNA binding protein
MDWIAANAAHCIFPMKAYLSVSEIAEVTNKEKTTVQRWIKAGKLRQAQKVGNEYRIPHEAFKKWWDANMKGAKLPDTHK